MLEAIKKEDNGISLGQTSLQNGEATENPKNITTNIALRVYFSTKLMLKCFFFSIIIIILH